MVDFSNTFIADPDTGDLVQNNIYNPLPWTAQDNVPVSNPNVIPKA